MTQVIACAVQLGGMPVPVGGGVRLVDALAGVVRDAGGELRTGASVERITVAEGRATGVVLADGEAVAANRAVVAGVTPTQLYGSLLRTGDAPQDVRAAAQRYRYGRAGMQIHLALDEPPRWKGPDAERLSRTAIVHVTPGLDGVSRAVNEAERGLLPAEATIVAGQPCAVDPSRAPEGRSIVWIQLQELPAGAVKGDAAGELDVGDGTWTEELREAYADRIVGRLGESIENLSSATLRRIVLSPADLEALNPNLVAGDIYAGSCALDQNLIWRPFAASPGHRTTIEGLWHVGASTHPGPGLGAGSGYLVAKELTKPPLTAAARCKASRTLVRLVASPRSPPECVVRRGRRGLCGRRVRRDRPLGDRSSLSTTLRTARSSGRHGLAVSNCVPTVPSFLQLAIPGMEGPADPEDADRCALRLDPTARRLRARSRSVPERPARRRSDAEGRDDRRRGSATVGTPRSRRNVRLGSSPSTLLSAHRPASSNSLADALSLLDEAGCRRRRDHGRHVQPRRRGHRRTLAKVVDRASRGSTWLTSRASPTARTASSPSGGRPDSAELVAVCVRTPGWDGTLDVEIFSTPDAFWSLPLDEAARRAYAAAVALADPAGSDT